MFADSCGGNINLDGLKKEAVRVYGIRIYRLKRNQWTACRH